MNINTRRLHCTRGFVALLALAATAVLAGGTLDRKIAFDIPAQSLTQALLKFGQQANVQIMLAAHSADGQRSGALKGTLRADEALARLLQGSGRAPG